jgi:hypothetical protein
MQLACLAFACVALPACDRTPTEQPAPVATSTAPVAPAPKPTAAPPADYPPSLAQDDPPEAKPLGIGSTLAEFRAQGWTVSEPLDVAELDRTTMANLSDDSRSVPRAADSPHDEWEDFKARMQPGDTLVELSTPPEAWGRLGGWGGYVIVRGGRVVATFTTLVS